MEKRCSNCNGSLKLSADKTKWICDFCESEFWIEEGTKPNFAAEQSSSATCYIGTVKVSKESIQKIDTYMATNQKLNAIKFVREISGLGLADAKTWVESYKNYNLEEPQKFEPATFSTQQTANKSGCYVATCVYGSYDCPQVWTLRRYRDNTLGSTWYGRLFIRTYYAISPTLVKWFGNTNWFKKFWKGFLDRLVTKLQNKGVENTQYQDKEW